MVYPIKKNMIYSVSWLFIGIPGSCPETSYVYHWDDQFWSLRSRSWNQGLANLVAQCFAAGSWKTGERRSLPVNPWSLSWQYSNMFIRFFDRGNNVCKWFDLQFMSILWPSGKQCWEGEEWVPFWTTQQNFGRRSAVKATVGFVTLNHIVPFTILQEHKLALPRHY